MAKRLLGVLTVVTFVLLLNSSFAVAQDKITLRFSAHTDHWGNIAEMMRLYESRHPNIQIVWVDEPEGETYTTIEM